MAAPFFPVAFTADMTALFAMGYPWNLSAAQVQAAADFHCTLAPRAAIVPA
jgi:hypothetical protein